MKVGMDQMGNILCEKDFLDRSEDSETNIVSVAKDCPNDKSEDEQQQIHEAHVKHYFQI